MAQKHDAKAEKAAAAELRASNAAARRPKRSLRKAPNSVDAVEDFLASHVRVSPPWPQQAPDPELCVVSSSAPLPHAFSAARFLCKPRAVLSPRSLVAPAAVAQCVLSVAKVGVAHMAGASAATEGRLGCAQR